jgi:hypothetical protein
MIWVVPGATVFVCCDVPPPQAIMLPAAVIKVAPRKMVKKMPLFFKRLR